MCYINGNCKPLKLITMIYKLVMKILGWEIDKDLPVEFKRCVLIAAPHTSNWDFIYTMLAFKILKVPYKFTIKKEWFRFPFNLIMKPLGGVSIDTNSKKNQYVKMMSSFFKLNNEFIMTITPEGSRSKVKEWRSGFYQLAKKANVPICLGYVDYKNKIAGVGGVIFPSNNTNEDMKKIMDFYKTKTAKFPDKFSIDLRYS